MKYYVISLLCCILPISVFAEIARLSNFRDWKDCYSIKNEKAEVILCPVAGGRVLYYAVNGKNIIFEDPGFDGYLLDDFRKDRRWPDGGRFDIGPESILGKQRDELFMGEWQVLVQDDYTVELLYDKENKLGVSVSRKFILHEKGSQLTLTQVMTNQTTHSLKRHYWGRVFCKGGGTVILPLDGKGGWGFMGKHSSEHMTEKKDRLEYTLRDEVTKVGSGSHKGWLAYKVDGLEITQEFLCFPGGDYSDTDGYTTIFYANGKLCELEPVSPMVLLQPGQSYTFIQKWRLREM